MAAISNESNGTKYYTIREGKLWQTVEASTPKAIERTKKNGGTYWELKYDGFEGQLIGASVKETPWNDQIIKSWKLFFVDEFHLMGVIEMAYNSSYASKFFNCLGNLDPTKPFTLMCYKFDAKDEEDNTKMKTIQGLNLYQEKEKVPPMYTKENQGALPQLEKVTRDGKEVWDSSAQMAFYHAWFLQDVKQYLVDPRKAGETNETVASVHDGVPAGIAAADTDDLPF
jgi:hypothetical protein